MDRTQDNRRETTLQQNAAFIRSAYRRAVFPGMLAILSVSINVFVDGILVGRRFGADALAALVITALDWMKENYGSALGYITRELDVSEAEIEQLRNKYLEGEVEKADAA